MAKYLAALSAMLEDAGIALATDVSPSDLYGNKWDTLKSFYLADEVPSALFDDGELAPDDVSGFLYVVHYNYLKIIRKHKTEKRQLSEGEIEERRIKKSRREIKSLYRQMHAEMTGFVQALINDDRLRPNDPSLLLSPLWSVILKKGGYVSTSSIISIMAGKEAYQLSDSERSAALDRIYALPLYQQMMAVAVKGCDDLELMDYNGHYSDSPATIFLTLFSCLSSIGFSFANDEYEQVMDGTHELYEPWADCIKEDTAWDVETSDSDAADDDTTVGYDEDYIEALIEKYESDIQNGANNPGNNDISLDNVIDDEDTWEPMPDPMDGFVAADNPSEVPFKGEETDSITEQYPTVYSTDGGYTSEYVPSDSFNEINDAA